MMSLIKFICCILTFSMLITYIYGDYNDDVSNTISSGCYPDLHVPMTNSYPSIFIDQTANIPLSQSNWDSNLCHITSIPLAFKLAVGVNNVKFNSSFILPAISRYSTTITLPVNPALFIQDDNLPGYLVVREINSGNGFKPASLTDGRVPVAIVYERPKVYTSSVKIYRTQTIQLRISGEGFTDRFSKMSLMFSPNIGYESIDYTVTVLNREELIVTLLDGRSWGQGIGNLIVTQVILGTFGAVPVGGVNGVRVAEIIEDYDQLDKTGFEVFPSSAKFYPSSPLYSTLTVHGTGFKEGMSLTLTPKLKVGVDYDVVYIDKHTLNLSLRPNKKWPVGILSVTRLNNVSLGDGVVQIAEFLAFPYIYSSNNDIYLSKSKSIIIKGSGFTILSDTQITLSIDLLPDYYGYPKPIQSYFIESVTADTIRLGLKPGSQWITYQTYPPPERTEIKVTRIDTGAGAVSLKSTVIGYIVPDPLPLPPVIITDDNADRSSNDEERDPDPGNNPSSPGSSSAPTMTPISNSENDDNDNILSSKSPFNNMHNIPTTTVTPSSTSADAPSISDNTNVNNTPGVSQSGSQGSMMLGVMLGLLFFCLWGALCFYIYVRVRMHRSTTTTDTMDEGQLSSSKDISTSKLGYKQVARGQEDLIEIELNDTHPRHDAETNA